MAKKKISAKQAVDDIRSGMDDAALMTKYGLASDGLQNLFDKLVAGGHIDLGEIRGRMRGFLGTVIIAESDFPPNHQPLFPKGKSPLINAQEAARDLRAGMDDPSLMLKYGLSSKGIQSLFNKLMARGLISQSDLDQRSLGIEHIVYLSEESLSLSQAMERLNLGRPESDQLVTNQSHTVRDSPQKEKDSSGGKDDKEIQETKSKVESHQDLWYDNPVIVILLVFFFFPLGFYGLYLNTRISAGTKVLVVALWLVVLGASLALFTGGISPEPFFRLLRI